MLWVVGARGALRDPEVSPRIRHLEPPKLPGVSSPQGRNPVSPEPSSCAQYNWTDGRFQGAAHRNRGWHCRRPGSRGPWQCKQILPHPAGHAGTSKGNLTRPLCMAAGPGPPRLSLPGGWGRGQLRLERDGAFCDIGEVSLPSSTLGCFLEHSGTLLQSQQETGG